MSINFRGIIPPVTTLFDLHGQLDKPAMKKLIDHLIKSEVDGLFFLGSAGEFSQMSDNQRFDIMTFCTHYVAGRKPVLLGIAHCGTSMTLEFGRHAYKCGADGVVIINPWYTSLSEEALYEHFQYIALNLTLPVILYNFPALTGQSIGVECIKRLALNCPNIVGLKDTVDSLKHIRETLHAVKPVRPDFAVFSGYDEYLLGTLILGGDGAIPASANFVPDLTCGIYRHWQQGEYAQANMLQETLSKLPVLYELEMPFYNIVKYALTLVGLDIPVHSLGPTLALNESTKEKVREVLKSANII